MYIINSYKQCCPQNDGCSWSATANNDPTRNANYSSHKQFCPKTTAYFFHYCSNDPSLNPSSLFPKNYRVQPLTGSMIVILTHSREDNKEKKQNPLHTTGQRCQKTVTSVKGKRPAVSQRCPTDPSTLKPSSLPSIKANDWKITVSEGVKVPAVS